MDKMSDAEMEQVRALYYGLTGEEGLEDLSEKQRLKRLSYLCGEVEPEIFGGSFENAKRLLDLARQLFASPEYN
jgi:hypothetical protein